MSKEKELHEKKISELPLIVFEGTVKSGKEIIDNKKEKAVITVACYDYYKRLRGWAISKAKSRMVLAKKYSEKKDIEMVGKIMAQIDWIADNFELTEEDLNL